MGATCGVMAESLELITVDVVAKEKMIHCNDKLNEIFINQSKTRPSAVTVTEAMGYLPIITPSSRTMEGLQGSVLHVLIYSFIWSSLYFTFCLLNPRRSYEWHCRSVTAIHAIVVTFLSAWCGFVQGPWPFTEAGAAMLCHHTLSILGLTVSVISGYYGTEMIATIFGSEATNPLLQTRWFLRETHQYHSLLGEIVDHAFMFSFGFLRIGIGTYLVYSYFIQPTDLWGRLGCITMYGISWLFWVNIVQYAINKYKKKYLKYKKRKQEEKGQGDKKCNRTVVSNEVNGNEKLSNQIADDNTEMYEEFVAKLHQNGVIKGSHVIPKNVHFRGSVPNGYVNGASDVHINPTL
ncbi:hypothetical protein KUTeg_017273 [Tegillarca granosa]|uniref:TLC domain-containing protein n=1 Tax=Tegillarca granosa TaxID=220873 RepID=A0ABQ9EP55_TEGGR|nr:hypothetical protein KUTeg_017273 [Tegillarca granosa]